MNRVSIASDNGLLPIRRLAIILTNAGLLLIGPLGTSFIEILILIHKKASENIVCEMAAILSRGRWVNGDTVNRDALSSHINGLVQERRNFIANALKLRLSWTNPSILCFQCSCWYWVMWWHYLPLLWSTSHRQVWTTAISVIRSRWLPIIGESLWLIMMTSPEGSFGTAAFVWLYRELHGRFGVLTHRGWVMHICISKLGCHCFR